jgi:hypothetical protein
MVLAPSALAHPLNNEIFKVEEYPAKVHGSDPKGATTLITEAGRVECQRTVSGTLVHGVQTLVLTPSYGACTGFELFEATVKPEGCKYVYHLNTKAGGDSYQAHVSIDCPEGQSIKVTVGACKFEIKPQNGFPPSLVNFENMTAQGDITMEDKAEWITYTVTQDGFGCPFNGTGPKSKGQFISDSPTTLVATTWGGGPNDFDIGG